MEKCLYYKEKIDDTYCKIPDKCLGADGYPECTCDGDKSKCSLTLSQSKELAMLVDNRQLGDWVWQGMWLTLPLYPWFNETTKQVYGRNIFAEMVRKGITFRDFKKMLDAYVRSRNTIFGTTCCNSEYYLVRDNKRFSFGFSDTFNLWNDFSQSLGHFKINLDKVPSKEFIEWIETVTKEYCEGIVHCSDCGKAIKETEISGRYFAGIYCEDCWNRKWKAIEAKETYD